MTNMRDSDFALLTFWVKEPPNGLAVNFIQPKSAMQMRQTKYHGICSSVEPFPQNAGGRLVTYSAFVGRVQDAHCELSPGNRSGFLSEQSDKKQLTCARDKRYPQKTRLLQTQRRPSVQQKLQRSFQFRRSGDRLTKPLMSSKSLLFSTTAALRTSHWHCRPNYGCWKPAMQLRCSSPCRLLTPWSVCRTHQLQLQSARRKPTNKTQINHRLILESLHTNSSRKCMQQRCRLNDSPQVLSSREARLVVLVREKSLSWLLEAPPVAFAAGRLVLVADAADTENATIMQQECLLLLQNPASR